MTILNNEPMKNRSSFRTGGTADVVVLPESIEELVEALGVYKNAVVLGNCTNTLVTDKGIRGVVVITAGVKGFGLEKNYDEGIITAACGESLNSLATFAMQNSLTGLEFSYGIPGTVGGGVFMNAGAYGGEIQDVVEKVTLYSPDKGIYTLTADEMKFGYRTSIIKQTGDTVVSASFRLKAGNKEEINTKMEEYMALRKLKQPLEYPSCGSTFKRPQGYYAGRLIEESGLKGASVGGAMVSTKHAGFVINYDNATSKDILDLINLIKTTVFEKFGVMLEEEVRIIGE